MNSKRVRSGLIYLLLIIALGAFLYTTFGYSAAGEAEEKPIGDIAEMVRNGTVATILVKDDSITVDSKTGETVVSRKELDTGIVETLTSLGVDQAAIQNVTIEVEPPRLWESWGGVLFALLPLLLLAVFFFFILRQAQGAGNQAFSFGKSRARMFTGDRPTVTFDDVAGNEEAKHELQEVVEFLQEPQKFAALGARIPRGVLLVGPPGTGKTLVAKAVSGEAGVPFFSISGSEFVEMFVGVGASRVRDLFEQAKKNSPCIIFVDEIDAVGRHRGAGMGGSHDEREQTLNQILVEMDGFDTDTNIIVIAATNRPDILDPALLRPGRFDRRVTMDAPDVKGRRAILDVHVRGKPLAADVDLELIAKRTPGFAGADIENLVNEAAILAARRNRRSVGMAEFEEAVERVMAGPERRSRVIAEDELAIVAYHEAGHAVVSYFNPDCDPVTKVTIIPRGNSLGSTWFLPDEETSLYTTKRFMGSMVAALGGRVAEQIQFDSITNGATGDLESVTNMSRSMVTKLGMSEKLGPILYGEREEMVFLGRTSSERRNYSDKVAQQIDEEVTSIVEQAHTQCHQIMTDNWDKVEILSQSLIEFENINGEEFEALMLGEDPFVQRREEELQKAQESDPVIDEEIESSSGREDSGLDLGNGTLPAPA